MNNSQAKKIKKGKLKMFLLFLLITTFIWFLSKFSKEFTATVDASIQYINLPKEVLISNKVDNLSFDLTANGFDFLFYKINKPVVFIDIKKYYKKNNPKIVISNQEVQKIINTQLKKKISIKNVSIENLQISLDQLESKKIRVKLNKKINFEKGYKLVDDFVIKPDSIKITGPSQLVDTIEYVLTNRVDLTNVRDNVSMNIDLLLSENKAINYSNKQVQLSFTVEEFIQKSIIIPIIINNLPKDITLKIIPEIVTISFDVSMKQYNEFSKDDFSIICDYNKRNEESNFMIPLITQQPKSVFNIELSESKINYLVFK